MEFFLIDDSANNIGSIARISSAEVEGHSTQSIIQQIDVSGDKPAELSDKDPWQVKREMIAKGYRETDGAQYFEKAIECLESRLNTVKSQMRAYHTGQQVPTRPVFTVEQIMAAA